MEQIFQEVMFLVGEEKKKRCGNWFVMYVKQHPVIHPLC